MTLETDLFTLTADEAAYLETLRNHINIGAIIDRFYDELPRHPAIGPFFDNVDISALKKKQHSHWHGLMSKRDYETTLGNSAYVGDVHEKLGVTPELYLAGYALVFEELLERAIESLGMFAAKYKRRRVIAALSKMVMADIAASLSAYVSKSGQTAAEAGQRDLGHDVMDGAVEASIGMNKLYKDNLKAYRYAADVDERINAVSASVEEMSTTMRTISDNTQAALDSARETGESAQVGHNVSEQASAKMGEIKSAINDTTQKAHSLSEASKQIEGIVTRIQDIADQTNLLALNATIEAARAGEAGKGFAVVANEVKSLSSQTGEATREISDIINNLVASIDEIVTAMDTVNNAVETGEKVTQDVKARMQDIQSHARKVGQQMDEISTALTEQQSAADEIASSATHIMERTQQSKEIGQHNAGLSYQASERVTELVTMVTKLTQETSLVTVKLAKSDHVVWMRKIADMLMGNQGLKDNELKDHTQCRLGAWYYAMGQQHFAHLQAFQDLEAPHKRVHEIGREAYDCYKRGDHRGALDKLEEMEEVSEQVLSLLSDIEKSLQAQ